MITFEKVTPLHGAIIRKIERLNEEVFPIAPDMAMLTDWSAKQEGTPIDFIALKDRGQFRGYAYAIDYGEITFLAFLAIEPKYHGKGYGTKLLEHIKELNAFKPIILTAFKPIPENEDYEECLRRRAFYMRNGFVPQPGEIKAESYHRSEIYLHGSGPTMEAMQDVVDRFANESDAYTDWWGGNDFRISIQSRFDKAKETGMLTATAKNVNFLKYLSSERRKQMLGNKERKRIDKCLDYYYHRYNWNDQLVTYHGKVGVQDVAGNMLVPPLYDEVRCLGNYFTNRSSDPMVAVLNGKQAMISTLQYNHLLTGFTYDSILPWFFNWYRCWKDGKTGVIDNEGSVLIPAEMDFVEKHGPYFRFGKGRKCGIVVHSSIYGVLDNAYQSVGSYITTPPIFDDIIWPTNDEPALQVKLRGRWGYLDKDGDFTTNRWLGAVGIDPTDWMDKEDSGMLS